MAARKALRASRSASLKKMRQGIKCTSEWRTKEKPQRPSAHPSTANLTKKSNLPLKCLPPPSRLRTSSFPMGRIHPRRSPSGAAFLLVVLVGLLMLACSSTANAGYVSRRHAIQRHVSEVHAGAPKHYRIGVKQMPPMCFYDSSLPEDQQFSGVRGNPPFTGLSSTPLNSYTLLQLVNGI